MRNTLLIIIVTLLALTVPVYGYWQWRSNQTPSVEENQEIEVASDENGWNEVSSSFQDLLRRGQDLHCTFTTMSDEAQTEGEIYVRDQGDQFRGEFITMSNSLPDTQVTHVLRNTTAQYYWIEGQETGYMLGLDATDNTDWFSIESTDEPDDATTEEATEPEGLNIDQNTDLQFNCEPWQPRDETFTPPSSVEFVDMQAQFEAMMEMSDKAQAEADGEAGAGEDAAGACAACEQLPAGDAKQQCLDMLGC